VSQGNIIADPPPLVGGQREGDLNGYAKGVTLRELLFIGFLRDMKN